MIRNKRFDFLLDDQVPLFIPVWFIYFNKRVSFSDSIINKNIKIQSLVARSLDSSLYTVKQVTLCILFYTN